MTFPGMAAHPRVFMGKNKPCGSDLRTGLRPAGLGLPPGAVTSHVFQW
jgi:hypothetical protein